MTFSRRDKTVVLLAALLATCVRAASKDAAAKGAATAQTYGTEHWATPDLAGLQAKLVASAQQFADVQQERMSMTLGVEAAAAPPVAFRRGVAPARQAGRAVGAAGDAVRGQGAETQSLLEISRAESELGAATEAEMQARDAQMLARQRADRAERLALGLKGGAEQGGGQAMGVKLTAEEQAAMVSELKAWEEHVAAGSQQAELHRAAAIAEGMQTLEALKKSVAAHGEGGAFAALASKRVRLPMAGPTVGSADIGSADIIAQAAAEGEAAARGAAAEQAAATAATEVSRYDSLVQSFAAGLTSSDPAERSRAVREAAELLRTAHTEHDAEQGSNQL